MDIGALFDLRGKTALVTGGSSGIGYMIAGGLVAAGVKTYICARKEVDLNSAVTKLRAFGDCYPITADLSLERGIEHVADTIVSGEKSLHILVNNAGATWSAPLKDFPRSAFEKVLNVNVTAPFDLIRRLLPLLRRGASDDDPARVINIASISGLNPPPRETYPYSASKAALIMLTRHLAERLAKENITVNAIAPGVFPSKMTEFMFDPEHPRHRPLPDFPLGRAGRPDDIAGAIIYLASRAGSYLTGVTIPLTGGSGLD